MGSKSGFSWNWIDTQKSASPITSLSSLFPTNSFSSLTGNTVLPSIRKNDSSSSFQMARDYIPSGSSIESNLNDNNNYPINTDYSFIRKEEGFRPKAYYDVNGYAIGYGSHTLNGRPVSKDDVISQSDADSMWHSTVAPYARKAMELMPNADPSQHEALTSFIYNHGVNSKRVKALGELIRSNAPTEDIIKTWTYSRNPTLQGRREREAKLFLGLN